MKMAFPILLGILSTGCLLAALHMVLACHFSASWLHALNMLPNDYRRSRRREYLAYVYFFAAAIGFGVMAYNGVKAALWWTPADYKSVRDAAAAGVALWLSFQIPLILMGHAGYKAEKP